MKATSKRTEPALEVAIVAAYQAGFSTKHIAQQFGLSRPTIGNILWRNGVELDERKSRLHASPSADQVAEMVRLYTVEELNTHQIAKKLGIASSTVLRYLGRSGVAMRAHVKRNKLAPAQRAALVERYLAGENFADLHAAYGVSDSVVQECLAEYGAKARAPGKRLPAWQDAQGRTWFFASRWEQLYAGWLDREGLAWVYEERCFKLDADGHNQFTPDFVVTVDGVEEYHEVKGWLHEADIVNVRAFVAQYPAEAQRLRLIGPTEMAARGLERPCYAEHPQAKRIMDLRGDLGEVIHG